MTLPSYAVTFRGFPACPCLAEWLPSYEQHLRFRGVLGPTETLRIYQLIGGSEKSAGTHLKGGAFDLLDLPGDEEIWVARQMGADATWTRPYNWDGKGGMAHDHGVLTGCLHNGPAAYQIDAVRAGFNGLGHLGHGAPDTGPRPLSGRTWRQGIEWAKQQEDDMYTDADRARDQRTHDRVFHLQRVEKLRFQLDQTADAKRQKELRAELAEVNAKLDAIKD